MISFITGYYTIIIEGLEAEKFLNHIARNKINIYNVNRIDNTKIQFCIDKRNFASFKKVCKNNRFKVIVKKKTGIPFILKRVYGHKSILIGFILSVIVLFCTSQFVTDVHITAPEGINKNDIKNELYSSGIKPGVYIRNISRKESRDNLMSKFENIAYVSINIKGTNVFVTITKKSEDLGLETDSNFCNIIASKNGVVTKVIPRSGLNNTKEGTIVYKGETLISAADTVSLPEVWADTYYSVTKEKPCIDYKKVQTGKSKKILTLSLYDEKITFRRNIKFKDYVIDNKDYKLKLGNYTFPLSFKISTFNEVEKIKIKTDKETIKEELRLSAKKEAEYLLPISSRIVKAEDKFSINEGVLRYELVITVNENIAQVYNISDDDYNRIMLKENPDTNNSSKKPVNNKKTE